LHGLLYKPDYIEGQSTLVEMGCSGIELSELCGSKFTQVLLFLLENYNYNYNFEAHYLAENWNPLQGPTHSLIPLSILTQTGQETMPGFIMALLQAQDAGQNSLSCSGFGYHWILKRVLQRVGH